MPYLRPKSGIDTKRTWMSRCMRNERYKGKFTAPNQQLAVCLSMQERAGLPSRIEKMEFAKILKDTAASVKAWQVRSRGAGVPKTNSPESAEALGKALSKAGMNVGDNKEATHDQFKEFNMALAKGGFKVTSDWTDAELGYNTHRHPDGTEVDTDSNDGYSISVRANPKPSAQSAAVRKDSEASLKAWETRKRTYSAVGQGSDGFAVAASDHQVHTQSGKERVVAAGTVGGKYGTKEEAQAAAFNLNNPKANSKTMGGQIPRTPTQEKRHQKELESDNWHTRTMAQMRDKSNDSLKFIRQDASEAAKAMQSVGNAEKEGRYLDEAHYASMELNAREKFALKAKKADTLGLGLRF